MVVFHCVTAKLTVDNTGVIMKIVVSEHLRETLPEHVAHYRGAVIVADPHTFDAWGEMHIRSLCEAMRATLHLLPINPEASLVLSESVLETISEAPFALAIGSGTINDIVKYAAHSASIPYGIVATAPSMNGYSSANASLVDGGHKQSCPATAPAEIYVDLEVMATAPARMIAAGIGDVLCRSTVEADWRLAQVKGKADYNSAIMEPLRAAEDVLLESIAYIKERDTGAIRMLWNALLAGGDAMRLHGSSMPASQGEHMIAHAMEAQHGPSGFFHGEEIAVTTLIMSKLQHRLLAHPTLAAEADWIQAYSLSTDTLHSVLQIAGCPLTPEDIGWEKELCATTAQNAWKTRNRYGFLALANELHEPVI